MYKCARAFVRWEKDADAINLNGAKKRVKKYAEEWSEKGARF